MNSIPGTRLVCLAANQPTFSQSPNLPFRAGRCAVCESSNSSSLDGDMSSLSCRSSPRTPCTLLVSSIVGQKAYLMRNSSILKEPPATRFFLAIATALSTVDCIRRASNPAIPVSFATIISLLPDPHQNDLLALNSTSPAFRDARTSSNDLFAKSALVSTSSALFYHIPNVPSALVINSLN
jgi:hypothetical protein